MTKEPEIPKASDGKFSSLWIAAAWASFLVWLFHSFTVRAFFDSLRGAGKLLGGH